MTKLPALSGAQAVRGIERMPFFVGQDVSDGLLRSVLGDL